MHAKALNSVCRAGYFPSWPITNYSFEFYEPEQKERRRTPLSVDFLRGFYWRGPWCARLKFKVDPFSEVMSYGEKRNTLWRYGNGGTRFGISSQTGPSMPNRKATKASYFNPITALKRVGHRLKHCVDDNFHISSGQMLEFGCNRLDQITLGH